MVSNERVGLGVTLLLGLTLSALLMLMATAPAQAQSEDVCNLEVQFSELRAHLDPKALPITGGKVDKERAGLLKLVDDAQAIASIGKTSDAVKKLSDFTVKVDQLEAAGRIDAESAGNLLAKAGAVIECIDPPEEPSQTTA